MATLLSEPLKGSIGTTKYYCTIVWRNGTLIMDEPTTMAGGDKGPDPYSTLLAALAGCTLSTLRMYIDRKGWNIPEINVTLNMTQDTSVELVTNITRDITFTANITDEQRERLLVIASKCPVSKILENKIIINTTA
jgi:putative redox protein